MTVAAFVQSPLPDAVVAECTLCTWRSAESPLGEGPNAEWYARGSAAAEYRQHVRDMHARLPRFVRIWLPASGEGSTSDRGTQRPDSPPC